jgi:hypothetical protein
MVCINIASNTHLREQNGKFASRDWGRPRRPSDSAAKTPYIEIRTERYLKTNLTSPHILYLCNSYTSATCSSAGMRTTLSTCQPIHYVCRWDKWKGRLREQVCRHLTAANWWLYKACNGVSTIWKANGPRSTSHSPQAQQLMWHAISQRVADAGRRSSMLVYWSFRVYRYQTSQFIFNIKINAFRNKTNLAAESQRLSTAYTEK